MEVAVVWTRKGGLLVFLGTFSLVMGLIFADFEPIILALIIFTFFFLVLVMPKPDINVTRKTTNTTLFENAELSVNLKIDKVKHGFGTVEIFDRIPEYAKLQDGINHMIYNPQESQVLDYSLHFPVRGYYSVGPTYARISDHFNIFYHDHVVREKEPVAIFPHVAGLKEFKFMSKKNIHYPGEFLTPQAGASTEFYHIRNYIKGDSFKKINWKVYARKRELMVNEYEKENICDALIILDARLQTGIGSMTDNPLKYEIKAAMTLASALLNAGNRVAMVSFGDGCELLPPGYGHTQMETFRAILTRTQPKGNTTLWNAVYQATPYLYKRTTIIIVTTQDLDYTSINTITDN